MQKLLHSMKKTDDLSNLFQLAGAAALNLWKAEKLVGRTDISFDDQIEIDREVSLAKDQLNYACKHLVELGLGSGHLDV
jgi:hypothetical protein